MRLWSGLTRIWANWLPSGAVAASIVGLEVNALVAVAGALALGAAIGAVTGVIVAKGKVPNWTPEGKAKMIGRPPKNRQTTN